MKRSTGRAALSAVLVGATMAFVVTVTRHPLADSGTAAPTTEPTVTISRAASSAPSATPSATPSVTAPKADPALGTRVQEAMRREISSARAGVEVYDLQTDTVLASLNADQEFSSMSVVKLLIAIDALARMGWAIPSATVQAQLTRMLSYSDDSMASLFSV